MNNPTITQADRDAAHDAINAVMKKTFDAGVYGIGVERVEAAEAVAAILARHREAHAVRPVRSAGVDESGALIGGVDYPLAHGWKLRAEPKSICERYTQLVDPNGCVLLDGHMMEPDRAAEQLNACAQLGAAAPADGFWEAKDKAWLAVQTRIDNYLAKLTNEKPMPVTANELRFAIECLQIAQDDIAALKPSAAYADGWREGFKAGLEAAAEECMRIFKEASNERTDSALTSFRQNQISHGCVASSEAIRALPIPAAPANDNGGKGNG